MKHLPKIFCNAIPHKNQRYDTCGDYYKQYIPDYNLGKIVQIQRFVPIQRFDISKTSADYEFLVLIHEMIEWYLTEKRGIKESKITEFDRMFEKERMDGKWTDEEPGDDKRSPYRKEHKFATKIEKMVAKELGVGWDEYENTLNKL